jgi:hypothetical protein
LALVYEPFREVKTVALTHVDGWAKGTIQMNLQVQRKIKKYNTECTGWIPVRWDQNWVSEWRIHKMVYTNMGSSCSWLVLTVVADENPMNIKSYLAYILPRKHKNYYIPGWKWCFPYFSRWCCRVPVSQHWLGWDCFLISFLEKINDDRTENFGSI